MYRRNLLSFNALKPALKSQTRFSNHAEEPRLRVAFRAWQDGIAAQSAAHHPSSQIGLMAPARRRFRAKPPIMAGPVLAVHDSQ
jgi:hypothetical protein